jgi:hypothetical protein
MTVTKRITRRDFLGRAGTLAFAGATLGPNGIHQLFTTPEPGSSFLAAAQSPSAPKNLRLSNNKSLLAQQDFSYVGAFAFPGYSNPVRCLTGRYVGGQLRLLCTLPYANGADVLEFSLPTLSSGSIPGSLNTASLVRRWYGDAGNQTGLYYGADGVRKQWYGDASAGIESWVWPKALYWDPIDSRLYWMYGQNATDDYDVAQGEVYYCSFGASTLNDQTGVGQAIGAWSVGTLQNKGRNSGMLGIPSSFSSQYLGGRRLAIGFGCYRSIITRGDVSLGPSLVAIDTPTAAQNRGQVGSKVMIHYPYLNGGQPYYPDLVHPCRPHRDTKYNDDYDGWDPTGGVGFWDWRTTFFGALVWIDTPLKQGLFLFFNQGTGRGWYDCVPGCYGKSESGADFGYVWNPNDLIPVINGSAQPYWPQPSSWWRFALPIGSNRYNISTATCGWTGQNYDQTPSLWYDPTAQRVYIAQFEPNCLSPSGNGGPSICYVYQIT